MAYFKIIDQIRLSAQGLVCHKKDGRTWQEAHHMQGGLDGACGVYAMTGALSILGLLDSDLIWNDDDIDGRTCESKYVDKINEYNHNGIYKDGLSTEQVMEILESSYGRKALMESCTINKDDDEIIQFICDHISQNEPVITCIPGHWVLTVGYTYDEKDNITGLCILDPGAPNPKITYWNGYLDVSRGTGRKEDRNYYTDIPNVRSPQKVVITDAISVGLK